MTLVRDLPGHAAALILVALAACRASTTNPEPFCTEEALFGVVVEVRHAETGAPVAQGATMTLTEDDYVEVVDMSFDGTYLSGALERPGTYDVQIEKDGFADWRAEDVEVPFDGCHVVAAELVALLDPV